MPSAVLSAASGAPFPLVSGNFWSGAGVGHPIGEVRLKLHSNASGNAYISLSGGGTVNSGGFFLSGVNTTDGMLVTPGEVYSVPKLGLQSSGTLGIYATCDPAASGQARLYFEIY
jgi:hypothetical protein